MPLGAAEGGHLNRWKEYGQGLRSTISASTVGLELALSVGLGYFIGDWLDDWLGTEPYLMLALVIVGSIAGFLNLWRGLQRIRRQDDE
jgi:ATP synthase protein I